MIAALLRLAALILAAIHAPAASPTPPPVATDIVVDTTPVDVHTPILQTETADAAVVLIDTRRLVCTFEGHEFRTDGASVRDPDARIADGTCRLMGGA